MPAYVTQRSILPAERLCAPVELALERRLGRVLSEEPEENRMALRVFGFGVILIEPVGLETLLQQGSLVASVL